MFRSHRAHLRTRICCVPCNTTSIHALGPSYGVLRISVIHCVRILQGIRTTLGSLSDKVDSVLHHVVRIDERTLQLADLPQQLQVRHVHVHVAMCSRTPSPA